MKELVTDKDGHIQGDGKRVRPAEFFDDEIKTPPKPKHSFTSESCIDYAGKLRTHHEYDKDGRCVFCSVKAQCSLTGEEWCLDHTPPAATDDTPCSLCGALPVSGEDGRFRYRWA